MRRLQIDHLTVYEFAQAVDLLPHKLLLRPREGQDIRIESARLSIFPAHQLRWQRDVSGNSVAVASFAVSSRRLSIESRVLLQHYDDQPLNFLVADNAVRYPFQYDPAELIELGPYLLPVFPQDQPQVADWLRPLWRPGQVVETYLLLEWINKAIAYGFTYVQREQPGVQAPAATLAGRSGSCRDTATLFIEACRQLGLAARFVSGYLHVPGIPQGPGATHAWSEVYLPGAGWKGFDATSGLLTGNDHIAVAVSRHPESVPPVAGSFLAASPQSPAMRVSVSVVEMP
jgi:transglutaminase-like putative cysteine protease